MGAIFPEQLLDREQELEIIRGAIDEAAAGAGGLVLVEGPAGIGKTRLLRAAREGASQATMLVLHARGSELEREFPYGLVRQLFELVIAAAPESEKRALMSGPAKAVVPLLGHGEALPLPVLGDGSFPILHGLYWLAANLAERQPLLLAVDDAHWGDPWSLRFLHYLAGRIEEAPVLLALTARPAEAGAEVELIAAIASDPAARIVHPSPLSDAAVAELVRCELGPDAATEFCAACHRASAGNPFVLLDLLNELRAEGIAPTSAAAGDVLNVTPKMVSRIVLLRLARLSPQARELASAAAVLGDGADLRDAATLAGLDSDAALDAADALEDAGLLSSVRPVSFVHPLTRAAIYADLSAATRSRAHRSAGGLLGDRGADPDLVAVHLMTADPMGDTQTVELLRAAAARALERGVPSAAFRYLQRAWSEPPAAEARYAVLADLLAAANRAPRIPPELREPLIAELACTPELLTINARELAWMLFGTGHPKDASALLAEAIRAAQGQGKPALALEFEVQRLVVDEPRPKEIRARFEPYREHVAPDTPAERLWLAVEAWRLMLTGENAAQAAALAQRALDGWKILAEQPASPLPIQALVVLLAAEDLAFAGRTLEVMLAGAKAIGSAPMEAATLGLRSALAFRQGRIVDAAADARTAIHIARAHSFVPALPLVISWITDALIERGEIEEAQRELELSSIAREVPDGGLSHTPILLCRALVELGKANHAGALEDLMEIGRREERSGTNYFSWDSHAAVVLAALGEPTKARHFAEQGLERARRWGAPGRVGFALRALGISIGGDAGIERLKEAVELLAGTEAGLEHMRALVDLGAALRRAGHRAQAREPLRQALELARRRGALALARRAHDELAATGEKLGPLTEVGPQALTPSERRIADLAADGLTNREIAQTLFLSIKTVESHLHSAYRKLDVSSRKELRDALNTG